MVSEGDDHIRRIKIVEVTTWPNIAGVVAASHIELNYIVGVTSPLQGQINGKGAITGQTWTGPHVFNGAIAVPTLAQATSTTGAASTAFVQNEWSTRLPNYTGPITASTTQLNYMVGVTSGVQSQIDSKGGISGQTWTGTHVFPSTTTVGPLTPTIQGYLATVTSDVQAQINTKAAKAGDTYTGTHNFTGATAITVPTLPAGTAGSNAASLDFVNATSFSTALPGQSGNAGKVLSTNGTNAVWTDTLASPLNVPAGASGTQVPRANEVAILARGARPHSFTDSSQNGVPFAVWNQYSVYAITAFARPLPTTPVNNGDSIILYNHNNTLGSGNFTLTIPSGHQLFMPNNISVAGPNTLVFDSPSYEKYEFTVIAQGGTTAWAVSAS
jgi:hypothetical protein